MATKTREVGGGPATGLANDFVNFLRSGITTGSFGGVTGSQQFNASNPVGSTMGIAGILNDLLSGGAGTVGGSLGELIRRDTERGAGALRARFGAGGGTAFGTPAAFAESLFRAEATPRVATAIGGLQSNLIGSLLPLFAGLSSKGIAQRETIAQPSPWTTAAGIALPAVGTFLGGPAGGILGGVLGNMFGGGGAGGGAAAAPSIWNSAGADWLRGSAPNPNLFNPNFLALPSL